VAELAQIKTPEVIKAVKDTIPSLIQLLQGQDFHIRGLVVETLINIGEDAVPELTKTLKDGNPDVRYSAAGALESIGTPEALKAFNEHQESLIKMLQDPDPDTRISTIETLGRIGSQNTVSALVQVLQDQNKSVRGAAIEALGNMGKYVVPALILALQDNVKGVRASAAKALRNIGKYAIPALILALQDKVVDVRGSAAEALGHTGSADAVPALTISRFMGSCCCDRGLAKHKYQICPFYW
jgi:HEAT repeat protein